MSFGVNPKEEEDGAGGWFDFYSEPTIMIDHGEAAGAT